MSSATSSEVGVWVTESLGSGVPVSESTPPCVSFGVLVINRRKEASLDMTREASLPAFTTRRSNFAKLSSEEVSRGLSVTPRCLNAVENIPLSAPDLNSLSSSSSK